MDVDGFDIFPPVHTTGGEKNYLNVWCSNDRLDLFLWLMCVSFDCCHRVQF